MIMHTRAPSRRQARVTSNTRVTSAACTARNPGSRSTRPQEARWSASFGMYQHPESTRKDLTSLATRETSARSFSSPTFFNRGVPAKSRSREVAKLPGCQVARSRLCCRPHLKTNDGRVGARPFSVPDHTAGGGTPVITLCLRLCKAQRVARRSALAEFSFDVDTAVAQQQRQDAVAGAHHAFEVLNALADKFFFGSQLALAAL